MDDTMNSDAAAIAAAAGTAGATGIVAGADTAASTAERIEAAKQAFAAGADTSQSATIADLDALKSQLVERDGTINTLREQLLAADRRGDEQEARANAAEDAVATAAKAATASVTRATAPPKPRNLKEADSKLSGDDLMAALADADKADKKVEIAFSDGKTEIPGVPAVVVTGDVWKDHRLGKMLRDPVEVVGNPPGGTSYQIAGYALLIDGKQVAYCKRSDPISIAPGMKISLADDIVFS